jgi:hypothetical protein
MPWPGSYVAGVAVGSIFDRDNPGAAMRVSQWPASLATSLDRPHRMKSWQREREAASSGTKEEGHCVSKICLALISSGGAGVTGPKRRL